MAGDANVRPGDVVSITIGSSDELKISGTFLVTQDCTIFRLSDSPISFEISAHRDGIKIGGVAIGFEADRLRHYPSACRRELIDEVDSVIQAVAKDLRLR